jgi:hypothetical protein
LLNKPVSELLQLHKDRDLLTTSHGKLFAALSSLKGIQIRIKSNESLTVLKKPLDELLLLIEQRDKSEESRLGLSRVVSSIRTIQTRIVNGDKYIKTKEAEFRKEMGSVCPLCNQKIINHG